MRLPELLYRRPLRRYSYHVLQDAARSLWKFKMTKSIKRDPVQILSPLRYPGAKRRLSSYVAEALRINNLRPKLFVEPFAGGASVALQLAECDLVDKIALAELDPLVAAFWKTVFDDTEWLLEALAELEVSVENWDYFRENNFRSNRDRALACIFLNRTSFSGILAPSAGPIGGRRQQSKYKIDCRFAYGTVKRRINQAAKLRDRVLFVDRATWSETIEKVQRLDYQSKELFFYFDPPFYEAGPRLYTHYFTSEQHTELYKGLSELKVP